MKRLEANSHESLLSFADLVERSYFMVNSVRQRYGLSRIELGLLLDTIKEQHLWKGKAENFWAYVDDLRLNRSACRTYMNVARKFVIELGVSEAILSQLASCNMSVLDKAAKVCTIDNAVDVISAVLALHQRDAIAVLDELAPENDLKKNVDDVSVLFSRYMDLTDDRRLEFISRLKPQGATKANS